jgi:hypothetical protein
MIGMCALVDEVARDVVKSYFYFCVNRFKSFSAVLHVNVVAYDYTGYGKR